MGNVTTRNARGTRVELAFYDHADSDAPSVRIVRQSSPKLHQFIDVHKNQVYANEEAAQRIEDWLGKRVDVACALRQGRTAASFFALGLQDKSVFLEEVLLPPGVHLDRARQHIRTTLKDKRTALDKASAVSALYRDEVVSPAVPLLPEEAWQRLCDEQRETTARLEHELNLYTQTERLVAATHADHVRLVEQMRAVAHEDVDDVETSMHAAQAQLVSASSHLSTLRAQERTLLQHQQERDRRVRRIAELKAEVPVCDDVVVPPEWTEERCVEFLSRRWAWREADVVSEDALRAMTIASKQELPKETIRRARRYTYTVLSHLQPDWSCPHCRAPVSVDPSAECLVGTVAPHACAAIPEAPDARSLTQALSIKPVDTELRRSAAELKRLRQAAADWASVQGAFPEVKLSDMCSGALRLRVETWSRALRAQRLAARIAEENAALTVDRTAELQLVQCAIQQQQTVLAEIDVRLSQFRSVLLHRKELQTLAALAATLQQHQQSCQRIRESVTALRAHARTLADQVAAQAHARQQEKVNSARAHEEHCTSAVRIWGTLERALERARVSYLNLNLETLNRVWNEFLSELFPKDSLTASMVWRHGTQGARLQVRLCWKSIETDDLGMLSGGEFDRLQLAFLLALGQVTGSKLLLLDEAISTLDEDALDHTFALLSRVAVHRGLFVLCISHHSGLTHARHMIRLA